MLGLRKRQNYFCVTIFRQKKAQEEARKLAHIQRELMILDNLLTADVNVIRSRIEIASREFLDAQLVFIQKIYFNVWISQPFAVFCLTLT